MNSSYAWILLAAQEAASAKIIIIGAALVLIVLIVVAAARSSRGSGGTPAVSPEKEELRPLAITRLPVRPEADTKPAIIKNELDERITLDQIFAQQTGQWVCPRCETMHPMERTHCFICDYDRK